MARQRNDPDRKFMILLVGVTGAGKTTFASLASGKDLAIGHGLDPCTQDPLAVEFTLNGHSVILIDTPGFDDDSRNDVEILNDVAKWMVVKGLLRSQPLDGLILLHPVTRDFVSVMERRRTQLLEKLLGEDAYTRVTIATTMWGSLDHGHAKRLDAEYNAVIDGSDRLGNNGVWANFRKRGATVVKHENNKESAQRILQNIIRKSIDEGTLQTLLQKEMGDRGVGFMDSSLGQHIVASLEDDIRHLEQDLLNHRQECPPMGSRWAIHSTSYRRWKDWEAERNDLQKRLERREAQLARLNGFVTWAEQIGKFWAARKQVLSRLWG
ncbi:GTP-binding protein A [Podospora aff. communis PSN243]|uniref:GTP-binding protein A n=1 Tax=Podospora aff. communis PSN243 TaxID=3040156 RepID=A0AAV9GWE5_9PEZI|nr:GTP-binding protein A [Podospora aff. communis PSN243]